MTIDNQLMKAEECKRAGDFSQALEIYYHIWNEKPDPTNSAAAFGIVFCSYKLKKYQDVVNIMAPYPNRQSLPDFVKSLLGWSIYHLMQVNIAKLSQIDLIETLADLKSFCEQSQGLNPLTLAVILCVKHYEEQHLSLFVIQLWDLLNPALLDRSPRPNPAKPSVSFPSHYEQFVCSKSKALFSSEQYNACIALLESSLQESLSFHHDQDIWMIRRLAQCMVKTNQPAKALPLYEKVLAKKRDWFVYFELAEVYKTLGEGEKSLNYAITASQARGEVPMKIHVWKFLYEAFFASAKPDFALPILMLYLGIKMKSGWKIEQDAAHLAKTYNLVLSVTPDITKLTKDVMTLLSKISESEKPSCSGIVSNLLPNGKAGFIKSGDQSYYFRLSDCRLPISQIKIGLKVCYDLEPSYDSVKKQNSMRAVNIR
jgi:tetratricopeptide (TPR) repeat protein